MSEVTYAGYIVVFGLWWYLLQREGGIGIGFRFMYGVNVSLFFLVGPLLGGIFGETDPRFFRYPQEPAVQLSLVGLFAYLVGAYLLFPGLMAEKSLIPDSFRNWMADPQRLRVQYKIAWTLIAIGFASYPFRPLAGEIPTLRAVWSQIGLLIDTGLVMLCLHAVFGRRWRTLYAVGGILAIEGLIFSSLSGHAGFVFINGMFLACFTLLSVRFRLSSVLLLAAMGTILLVPVAYWLGGRGELRQAIQREKSFEERLQITMDLFLNPRADVRLDADSMVEAYRARGDFSDLLAAALVHTPAVEPFAMGETLADTLIAIVPRFLWPEKPYSAGGNTFVTRFTGIRFAESTSVGMNYLFELYVNFGWTGTILGMGILGLCLGGMERIYYSRARHQMLYEYATILAAWSICINSDTIALTAMSIGPGVLICWVLSRWVGLELPRQLDSGRISHSSKG